MIFIKKTSSLFDKNEKKCENELIPEENIKPKEEKQKATVEVAESTAQDIKAPINDDDVWLPKTQEEIKQYEAILEIRKLSGEDINIPVKVSDIKKLEAERLAADKAANKTIEKPVESKEPEDEIWVPETDEERKQYVTILEIRKLLGQDTSIPIKVSEIKKLEAEKLEAEKRETMPASAELSESDDDIIWTPKSDEEKMQHASMLKIRELLGQDTSIPIKKSEIKKVDIIRPVPESKMIKKVEPEGEIWEPKTQEEKRQQAAIIKIRELLGEDSNAPIDKHPQVKTQMLSAVNKDDEPIKRDPNVVIRLGEEEEISPQYHILKKLLEEDSAAKTPAKDEETPKSATSSWGSGNVFTVGSIINAKPTKQEEKNTQPASNAMGGWGGNFFNLKQIIGAEPEKDITAKQVKEKEKTLVFKSAPKATTPNSPFFMINFKDLTKD